MSGAAASGGDHLSHQLLDSFFTGEVTAYELLDRALDHLERSCPVCREQLAHSADEAREALARAEERARATPGELTREQEDAPALAAELEELARRDEEAAMLRVGDDPRLQTAAVARALLGRCREHAEDRSGEAAIRVLTLVHLTVQTLDPARYGPHALRLLAADAWVMEGLLAVDGGDLDSGTAAFLEAGILAGRGDGPRTGVLFGLARLRLAQGAPDAPDAGAGPSHDPRGSELRTARTLLEAALRGDDASDPGPGSEPGPGPWHWPVRAELARLLRAGGEPEGAIALLRDLPSPPRGAAQWRAGRELVLARAQTAERDDGAGVREAHALLDGWEDAVAAGGAEPSGEAELALLRGSVLRREGRSEAAEETLRRARERFLFLGRGLGAVLATLELLRLLLAPGGRETIRRDELRRLAGDLDAFPACADLTGEDLAALARCAGAAWHDRLTPSLLHRTERRIERRPDDLEGPAAPGVDADPELAP